MILPFGSMANTACSGSDCCTISSGVVTATIMMHVRYNHQPYGITIYDKYLCTSAITEPTTSSANADLTNCVRTFLNNCTDQL